MAGRKEQTGEPDVDNVDMRYGRGALKKDAIQAEIGVGFETPWHGTVVKGVIYNSGYLAIYNPSSWGPMQFAGFVREEIMPVAEVPDVEEDAGEQSTLDGEAEA